MSSYSYTGSIQYVTIPTTGIYDITAYGGQGGAGNGTTGGLGAQVEGGLMLTAGEHLEVVVGGQGKTVVNGKYVVGGGGGGSFVLGNGSGNGSGGEIYTPLVVAGGGGGGGRFANTNGGGGTIGSYNGSGGGAYNYRTGSGGAGVKSAGKGIYGGKNGAGGYAGGGKLNGGFGGGGGGVAGLYSGGGGGGGYGGGYGGRYVGGSGGGSYVSKAQNTGSQVNGENAGNGKILIIAVCYVSGTKIRIARSHSSELLGSSPGSIENDVTIDNLAIGDLVVTASGEHRPIRWLGHRIVDCRRHPRPHEVMPVRIAAHAFAAGRPARDLRVSPGHSICVDVLGDVLIPAHALVNGATIVQEDVDTVTYWHVELESHDVILAENLPCESYLEMSNRGFFAEGGVVALDASPDARETTHADFCRPFHGDGAVVHFVRQRVAARAPDLGWTLERKPLADLHLVVDGRRIEPETRGSSARFLLPATAEEAWLVSHTSVPSDVGMGADRRALGVCLGRLVIDDGFGLTRTIPADDPLLGSGPINDDGLPNGVTY